MDDEGDKMDDNLHSLKFKALNDKGAKSNNSIPDYRLNTHIKEEINDIGYESNTSRQTEQSSLQENVFVKSEPLEEKESNSHDLNGIKNDGDHSVSSPLSNSTGDPTIKTELPVKCELESEENPTSASGGTDSTSDLNTDRRCLICFKVFDSKLELAKHSNIHIGQEKFVCGVKGCLRTLGSIDRLLIHRKSHTEEGRVDLLKFFCGVKNCGRAFRVKYDLKCHMAVHRDENQYVCDFEECGRKFPTKKAFNLHKKIHFEHRPFLCEEGGCGAGFKTQKDLNRHTKTHGCFTCDIDGCLKSFASRKKLDLHCQLHQKGVYIG